MALPRLDYQMPDYAGGVGEALGGAAKTINDWSPAPDFIQRFARHGLSNKMDPREAAVLALLVHGGHIPDPTQSSQLTGGNVTFQGLSPQSPMGSVGRSPTQTAPPGPMSPASPPAPGGFTGAREFTGPEETVTGTRLPANDLSALNPETSGNAPIRNKDVPVFMQMAGQQTKHDPMDSYMKLYAMGLRGRELDEKYREFEGMAPVRQSMINQRDAGISNMPFANQQRASNTAARWAGVGVAQGNLATRQNEGYLKGTNDVAAPIAQIKGLLGAWDSNPDLAIPSGDYRVRREAEIVQQLPVLGKGLANMMRTVADSELTPEQRTIRRQAALAVASFQHMMVGSQITEGEMAMVNMLAGQQLSMEDTRAGLGALMQSMEARQNRYKAGYPDAAKRIPDVSPGDVTPQFSPSEYPTGFGGPERIGQPPISTGPSLQDELNQAPQNQRRLKGSVTSSFGGP